MPIGISNVTSVTMQNLTDIANVTTFPEFMINVNNVIYGGILYFLLLWVLWVILFMAGRETPFLMDKPMVNLMYGGAIVSIISFFLRGIYIVTQGVYQGLLTDVQMWIFPILTIVIAAVIKAMK